MRALGSMRLFYECRASWVVMGGRSEVSLYRMKNAFGSLYLLDASAVS